MTTLRYFALFLFFFGVGCKQSSPDAPNSNQTGTPEISYSKEVQEDKAATSEKAHQRIRKVENKEPAYPTIKGALLSTRFTTLEELKSVVQIEYRNASRESGQLFKRKPLVRITHSSHGRKVTSVLETGINESDFIKAGVGSFWDKVKLAIDSPYFVVNRKDLLSVYNLSRRRGTIFGEGDKAFYDLAETMLYNISEEDLALISAEDLSEKGYLNTFNHITAQAFMTSIFSEKLADFIADTHERRHLPELITGKFTEEQLTNIADGPVDNYVDIINNEWGQELGKVLREKFNIYRETYWTPELLANFLNDIQRYYSWAFQIGFKPFKATDELVITFSNKINTVMDEVPPLR